METHVSGILSKHGRTAETATVCKRKEIIYISDNTFHVYVPQTVKTGTKAQWEDHVLETSVSGILSEHGKPAQAEKKFKTKDT